MNDVLAFPLVIPGHGVRSDEVTSGMTLRDYFAAHAPACVLELEGWTISECAADLGIGTYKYREHYRLLISKLSYEYADAMLAERAK